MSKEKNKTKLKKDEENEEEGEKSQSEQDESSDESEESEDNYVKMGKCKVAIFSGKSIQKNILETSGIGPCISITLYGKANVKNTPSTSVNFVGLYHWADMSNKYPRASNATIPVENEPSLENCIIDMKADIKEFLFQPINTELHDNLRNLKINSITITGVTLVGGQKAYKESPDDAIDNISGTEIHAVALKTLFTDQRRINELANELGQELEKKVDFSNDLKLDMSRILIAQGEDSIDLAVSINKGHVIIKHKIIKEKKVPYQSSMFSSPIQTTTLTSSNTESNQNSQGSAENEPPLKKFKKDAND